MQDADDSERGWAAWFRNPDALVLAAPMGVSLLVAGAAGLVQAGVEHLDPFLRDILVFGYGTLGPPAVGLAALYIARGSEPREFAPGVALGSLLLLVPGYWLVVLAVCALFALDLPPIGAIGLLASYAAFCSFGAWLRLRPRPRLQQGLALALLLAVGATGAIPSANARLRPEPPRVLLGRSGPPPPALPAEESRLPAVSDAPPPSPSPDAAPELDAGALLPPAAAPLPAPEVVPERHRSALEDRMQRQLARNGLSQVDIRVEGNQVTATGVLSRDEERERLRLVVNSLAPYLPFRDLTRVAVQR